MLNLTESTVVLHPETGEPVLLAAGGPLPDWATDLVGEHLLDGPKATTATGRPAESPDDERARLLARLAELDGSAPPTGDDPDPEPDPDDDQGDDDTPTSAAGAGTTSRRSRKRTPAE